jgi:hypothetical protein
MGPTSGTTPYLCSIAMVVALVGASCGDDDVGDTRPDDASASRPDVSFLDYSPKPFYKDMTVMEIRFTTTGPAGPGRRYVVELRSRGNDMRCIRDHAPYPLPRIQGGAGKTFTVTLYSDTFFDDGRFCAGPAELRVWTERAVTPREGVRMLRRLRFRVLPPRSG